MTDQPTLPIPGYCWRCGGTGRVRSLAVVARGPREYECVDYPTTACPDCRWPAGAREAWLEASRIGRRP